MKLFKAMATVAGLTGVSRVFGFIRDILTAAILGAGPVADAFFIALKLPNFFRRVTAEGAFSVSFVPLYSEKLEKKENASEFASNAFSIMVLILLPFTILAIAGMPFVIAAIAPGFMGDELRYPLAVELSRVTFPYLLFMSLTALLGGVLNAHDKFAPFAAAPIFFNLCLIIALLFAVPHMQTAGHALAYGVFAAGVIQFLWLVYFVKRNGIKIRFKKPTISPSIKKLFALMGPGIVGAGVMHINLFADLVIASFLSEGSIAYLYYADRLNQLPLGMIGIAIGTALLPMLSKAVASKKGDEANYLFNRSLEVCFLFSIPAAAAFLAVAPELIAGLFERGKFDGSDTAMTAYVLMAYAIGMPAYVGAKIFTTVFHSHQDTLTPVKVAITATVTNICLSLILIQFIGVIGIALATGLTGWLQFYLMKRRLKALGGFIYDSRFKEVFYKVVLSAAVMGGVLYFVSAFLSLTPIVLMMVLVIVGGSLYGAGILISGAVSLRDLKKYLSKA